MKKIILTLCLFFISINNSFALFGDLGIQVFSNSSYHTVCKIQLVSIPFEGINGEPVANNRFSKFQNGSIFKIFSTSNADSFNVFPIYNFKKDVAPSNGYILDLGCTATNDDRYDGAWGLGKYKLSIYIIETGEKYACILNNLDTMYGRNNFPVQNSKYSSDWVFEYDSSRTINSRAALHRLYGGDSIVAIINTWDTLPNGSPSKEFTSWEVLAHRSTPYGNTFLCKTTPFPISTAQAMQDTLGEYTIGCKVLLDTVLENNTANKLYAYNTDNTFYSNSYIVNGVNLNKTAETFITPANTHYIHGDSGDVFQHGIKIIVGTNDNLILGKSKRLIVNGSNSQFEGDKLFFRNNSNLSLKDYSDIYLAHGGSMIDSGAAYDMGTGTSINTTQKSKLSYIAGREHNLGNTTKIIVNDSASFNVGANTTLVFDGSSSKLTLKPGASITMGANSKLVFKNGATIDAQNVTFSCSSTWKGIVLESPTYQTIIKNCIINNAEIGLSISYPEMTPCESVIENNTFNIPGTNRYGLKGTNVSSILLQGNTFAGGTFGVYFVENLARDLESEASFLNPEILKIIKNTFTSTGSSIVILSNVDALASFQIEGNTITPTNGQYNIILRKASGKIKGNILGNSSNDKNVFATQSSVVFFGNVMNAKYQNVYSGSYTTTRLAPNTRENETAQLVWDAGFNELHTLNSSGMDVIANLNSDSPSPLMTDYGANSFYISSNSYNFYGKCNLTGTNYFSRNNCFGTSGMPTGHLENANGTTMSIIGSGACNPIFTSPLGNDIYNLGYGIYDTIPYTDVISDSIPMDEMMYGTAQSNADAGNYLDAIITYKSLIDSFPGSGYLLSALGSIMYCYQGLDTFPTQEQKDILYGDLKLFLEQKISSQNYDGYFEDEAYELTLECLSEMKDTELALEGYEMIAMYHPDPVARLLATWDAETIEDWFDGYGGGHKEIQVLKNKIKALNISRTEINRVKEMNSKGILNNISDLKKLENIVIFENKKPIKEILQSKYQKTVQANEKKISHTNNSKIAKIPQNEDYRKIERMKTQLKSARKEDKPGIKLEQLIAIGGSNESSTDNFGDKIVTTFSLSQNYPNPFNPTTKINYELKNAGFVSLKIYDLLGREITELVNETKDAGRYSIDFNASKYMMASGVYFYRIQAGEFIDTKRMVLVK